MRFKFFPGSELGPPKLLGGIVDLDRPQHLVANMFLGEGNELTLQPIIELDEAEQAELEAFAHDLNPQDFRRVSIKEVMFYTTRHRAMC